MWNICTETIKWHHVISVTVEIEKRIVVKRNAWIVHKRDLYPVENEVRIINQNTYANLCVRIGFQQFIIRHRKPPDCCCEIRAEVKILPRPVHKKLKLVPQNQLFCPNVISVLDWKFVSARKIDSVPVRIIMLRIA